MFRKDNLFETYEGDIYNDKKLSLPTKEYVDLFEETIKKAREPYKDV